MNKDFDLESQWMKLAIMEAKKSAQIGEVPVGALIIHENKIIASDHNRTIVNNDVTSQAEINVIRNANNELGNHRLVGATLVVTLEPCAMCYGAIVQSRVSKLIFGAYDKKSGMCGSCFNLHETKCFNHKPEIISGILEHECSRILSDFFKERRS